MKKLLKIIRISPSLVTLVLIAIILNSFKEFILIYIIAFVHELGHALMACFFRLKIDEIRIDAFGMSIRINDIDYQTPLKQVLIYVAGPLTFLITYLLNLMFFKFNIINQYEYSLININNLSILFFNLLPIYPLDGGRVLKVILRLIYSEKKVCIYIKAITLIAGSSLIIVMLIKEQYLFTILIGIILLLYIINKNEYQKYLINRYDHNVNYKKCINFNNELFHFKNNFYLINNRIINEKDLIPYLMIKNKNKRLKFARY